MGITVLRQNYSLFIKYSISDIDQYHLPQRKTEKSSLKAGQVQQLACALSHDGLRLYKSWAQIKWEERLWTFYLPVELPFFSGTLLNKVSKYFGVKSRLLFMCSKVFGERQFYHILLISPTVNTLYEVKSSRENKIKLVTYTEPVPFIQIYIVVA